MNKRFTTTRKITLSLLMVLCAFFLAFGLINLNSNKSTTLTASAETVTSLSGTLSDGEYQLSADTTASDNITVASGSTVTIDLNGYTLSSSGSTLTVESGATLTIKDNASGGTITTDGTGYAVTNNGTLTISSGTIGGTNGIYNAGTLTVSGGTMKGDTYALYQYSGTVTINDGSFECASAIYQAGGTVYIYGGTFSADRFAINLYGGTMEIRGGTFTGSSVAVYRSSANGTMEVYGGSFNDDSEAAYLGMGAVVVKPASDGDYYTVYESETMAAENGIVAIAGGFGYASVTEALAATSSSDTINIIADWTENSALTIDDSKSIILDLNGHTLTISGYTADSYSALINNGTLTITSSTAATLYVYGEITKYADSGITNNGTLTIGENVTVSSYYYTIYNKGTVTVNGSVEATKYSTSSSACAVYNVTSTSTLTINDGASITGYYGVYGFGAVTVNGGTIEASYRAIAAYGSSAVVTITEGTISGTNAGIMLGSSSSTYASLTLTGGTITADTATSGSMGILNAGTVIMSGGTVSGFYGVRSETSSSSTTITGGTIIGSYTGVMALSSTITIGEQDGNDDALTITGESFAIYIYGLSGYTDATVNLYSGTIGNCTIGEGEDAVTYESECGIFLTGYSESTYAILNMYGGSVTATSIGICGNGSTDCGWDKINISGGSVYAAYGLYLPQQNGETVISGGEITGSSTGIEIRMGSLEVTGGTITSEADSLTTSTNGSGTTVYGAALAISAYNITNVDVKISGGTFTGYCALYEYYVNGGGTALGEDDKTVSIEITGGTFGTTSQNSDAIAVTSQNVTAFISGGEYSDTSAAAYVTDEYALSLDTSESATSGYYGIKAASSFVATVNGLGYSTLADAIEAAADGDTIVLTSDVSTEQVTISGKAIVLDLNGHTLSYDGTVITIESTAQLTISTSSGAISNTANSGYAIVNNGTLAIEGGTISGASAVNNAGTLNVTEGSITATDTTNGYAINNSGSVTISGGTISGAYGIQSADSTSASVTISGGSITGNILAVIVYSGTANISNGTITSSGSVSGFDYSVFVEGATSVEVTGGTYTGKVYSSDTALTVSGGTFSDTTVLSYLASEAVLNASTYVVYENSSAAIGAGIKATVGQAGYTTLKAAIEAAGSTATTITLVDDTTETITIANGQTITLDLNGKTLSSTATTVTVNSGATLTIEDSGTEGTISTSGDTQVILNRGSLTINGIKVTATFNVTSSVKTVYGINNNNTSGDASLVINDIDLDISATGSSYTTVVGVASGNGSLTINGGTFDVSENCGYQSSAYAVSNISSTLIITGGTFTSIGNSTYGCTYGVYGKDCEITISGDSISITAQSNNQNVYAAYGVYTNNCTITVDGGSITSTGNVLYQNTGVYNLNATLTINGGTITGDTAVMNRYITTITDGTFNGSIDLSDSTTVEVTGGSYSDTTVGKYLTGGSVIATEKAEDSNYYVVYASYNEAANNGDVVAIINGYGYTNLQAAITAAADGDEITLVASTSESVTISGKNIVLNLGGYTLTSDAATTITVESGAALTVSTDSGTISNTNTTGYAILNNGTLNVEGGVITGAYGIYNYGTLNITGGTISSSTGIAIETSGTSANVTIGEQGGADDALTIEATGSAYAIRMFSGATVDIYSGTITSVTHAIAIFGDDESNYTTLNVYGGSISATLFAIANKGTTGLGYAKINVEGGKITSSDEAAIYLPAQYGETTISGGTIVGSTGIEIRNGSLDITGGSISSNATGETSFGAIENSGGNTVNGAALAISAYNQKDITVTISGGEFYGYYYTVYECYTNGTYGSGSALSVSVSPEITGGTFDGKVYAQNATEFISGGIYSDTSAAAYVVDGSLLSGTAESGYYGVKAAANYVATVDGLGYETLQSAIDAAAAASSANSYVTVTLISDVTEDITLTSGYVTLDLGNYKITNATDSSTITVSGSSTYLNITGNGGAVVNNSDVSNQLQAVYVSTGATLTVENATLSGTYNGIRNGRNTEAGGTVILNSGASVIGTSNAGIQTYGTVTVNSGAKVEGAWGITFFGKDSTNYTTVTINGGSIKGTSQNAIANNGTTGYGYVTLNINGGTITSSGATMAAIYLPAQYGVTEIVGTETNPVTITGVASGIEIRNGSLTISGYVTVEGTSTTFSCNAKSSAETICGAGLAISSYNQQGVSVTIEGGTFKGYYAIYEYYANGNGTTNKDVAIDISGGSFTATNENGAAVYSQNATEFIKGGTYSDTSAKDYLDPEAVIGSEASSGVYTVYPDADTAYNDGGLVATVDGVGYTKLQATINAATAGSTVTLTTNNSENITISADDDIKIDLNGNTMSGTITIASGAYVDILNSDDDNASTASGIIHNYGNLYVYGSYISVTTIYNYSGAVLKVGTNVRNSLLTSNPAETVQYVTNYGGDITVVADTTAEITSYGGSVTINGGTVTKLVTSSTNVTISGGTIGADAEVTGGTVTISGGTFSNITLTGAASGSTITGGTFNGTVTIDGGSLTISDGTFATLDVKSGTVSISGGTFTNDVSNYVADNYTVVYNGTTYEVVESGTIVAKIGSLGYTSLQAAIEAASTTATTITLVADTTESVTVSGKSITIDLNGYSITATGSTAVTVNSGASLTIEGDGSVISGSYFAIVNSGTLVIENGTVSGVYGIYNTNSLTVNGGSISGDSYYALYNTGTAVINGGSLSSKSYTVSSNNSLTINGGTISATGTYYALYVIGGTATIGTVGGDNDDIKISGYYVMEVSYGANLTMNSGTITGYYGMLLYGNYSNDYTEVVINGGVIDCDNCGIYANGITSTSYTKVTVNGGTITGDVEGIYFPAQHGELYLYGGTITGETGVEVRGGTVVINDEANNTESLVITSTASSTSQGDTPSGGGSTVTGAAIAISSYNGENISVTISSGTFKGVTALYEAYNGTSALDEGKVSISVTGGTFNGAVSSENVTAFVSGGIFSDTSAAAYVVDGSLLNGTAEGGYYGIQAATTYVAKIGNLGYETLQAAINAAGTTQTTVILIADTTEDITIAADQNITLDLSGCTLTNASGHTITVESGATLTIEGDGTVDNVTHQKAAINNEGTVYLYGGTYTRSKEAGVSTTDNGGNSYYVILNRGTMVIGSETDVTLNNVTVQTVDSEGNLTGKYSSLIENGWYDGSYNTNATSAYLTINGGTFQGGLNTVKNDDYGVLTINNGIFVNDSQHAVKTSNTATINGGEFTSSGSYAVYVDKTSTGYNEGTLTINGGTFTGSGYAVWATDGAELEINDGTFNGGLHINANSNVKISGGEFNGITYALYTANSDVAVTGGTFAGGKTNVIYIVNTGNVTFGETNGDNSAIIINGKGVKHAVYVYRNAENVTILSGTYIGDIYSNSTSITFVSGGIYSDTSAAAYLVDGYTLGEANANGYYTLVATNDVVAKIGDIGYTSLEAAIEAAVDGDEITLVKDTTASVTISGKNIVLDLNGYTLSYSGGHTIDVASGAALTVKDGSIAQTGTISNSSGASYSYYTINNNGTLIIESGAIVSSNKYGLVNAGTANISGGTISGTRGIINNGGTLNVTGGTIYGSYTGIQNTGTGNGDVTISGGTIGSYDNNSSTYGIMTYTGTVTITGGTVTATTAAVYVDGKNSEAEVIIGGDAVITGNGSNSSDTVAGVIMWNASTVTVNDNATITAENTYSGTDTPGSSAILIYGPGKQTSQTYTTLTVNGGTISGGNFGIMGNGSQSTGSDYRYTNITINGGTIIGGSYGIFHPQDGTLTITDGTISGAKAAIEIRSGTLNISGGTFTATSTSFEVVANNSGTTITGAAIAISQHTTNNDVSVNITGGTFEGYYAVYEEDLQDTDVSNISIDISGGTFTSTNTGSDASAVSSENVTEFISGGYLSQVADSTYYASGYVPTEVKIGDVTYYTVKAGYFVAMPEAGTTSYEYTGSEITFLDGSTATGYTVVGGTGTEVGTYTVYVYLNSGYTWTDGTSTTLVYTYYITLANNSLTGTLEIDNWTYGETASTPFGLTGAAFGSIEYRYYSDLDCTNEIDITIANAGTYYVKAYVAETANYSAAESTAVAFTISKAENDISVTIDGWTYGETAETPVATVTGEQGTVSYKYFSDSTCQNEVTDIAAADAGTYYIVAYVDETTNYQAAESSAYEFTITQRAITITVTDASITYGDEAPAYGYTVTSGSVVSGDTITVTYDCSYAQYDGATTYAILATAANDNYLITVEYGTLTVTAKAITVTIGNQSSVYGNAVTVDQSAYSATGVVNGDDLGIALTTTATSTSNVGSYEISGTWTNTNYNVTFVNGTWTITKASVDIPTAVTTEYTYTGNDLTYTIASNSAYTVIGNVQQNAGTYTVTVTLNDTYNYQWSDGSTAAKTYIFTINKASVDIPTADTSTFTYNGNNQTYTIASNSAYTVDGNVQQNAGTYTVTVTLIDTDNYQWLDGTTAAKTYTFTINKVSVDIPTANTSTFTYNGSAQTYNITSNSAYTVDGNVQTDAGTYTVTVTLIDTDNYQWSNGSTAAQTYTFTINKATVAAPAEDTTTFVYTGNSQTYGITSTNAYTVSGGDQINAGTYTVTVTLDDTYNYQWSDGSTAAKTYTFTINKASVTAPTVTTTSFDFDGTEKTFITVGANALYTAEGTTSATQVGTYNVVLVLRDSDNYQWATGATTSFTWTISDGGSYYVAIPTASADTFVFDGTEKSFVLATNAGYEISGDTTGTAVGTYTVTLTLNANHKWVDGSDAAIVYTWTITEAELTVTSTDGTATYDGNTHTGIVSAATVDASAVTIKYGTTEGTYDLDAAPAYTNAGMYTVYYQVTAANHAEATGSYTVTISKATYDMTGIKLENATATYDGTAHSIAISGTLPTGVTASYIGGGTSVGTYTIIASFSGDSDNYEAIENMTATLTIAKASVTAPAADGTAFTYTGSEQTYTVAANDAYTVIGSKQTGAGTYTVTVALNDTANYEWSDGTTAAKTFTFTIAKASVTAPTADGTSFTYTGSEQTYTVAANDAYTVIGSKQTAAGTYTVTVALNDTANYQWADGTTAAKTFTFTIAKAANSVTDPTVDGTSVSGSTAAYGTVTYKYYADAACTEEITDVSGYETYYVRAEVAEGDNYYGAVSGAVEITTESEGYSALEIVSISSTAAGIVVAIALAGILIFMLLKKKK